MPRPQANRDCSPLVWLSASAALGLLVAAAASGALLEQTPPATTVHFESPARAQVPHNNLDADRCLTCHAPAEGFSHPVGVVMQRAPAGFPLKDGRLTCVTCHQAHPLPAAGAPMALQQRSGLPRSARDAERFCAACHDALDADVAASHARALNRAHLGWSSADPAIRARAERWADAGPESTSQSCLTCHDGSLATEVGHRRGGSARVRLGSQWSTDHPVDIPYQDTIEGADGRLAPRATLDPRVRLFGGSMTCASCHTLYAQSKGLLAVEGAVSALCLSCHAY